MTILDERQRIARLWNAYLHDQLKNPIDAEAVGNMLLISSVVHASPVRAPEREPEFVTPSEYVWNKYNSGT